MFYTHRPSTFQAATGARSGQRTCPASHGHFSMEHISDISVVFRPLYILYPGQMHIHVQVMSFQGLKQQMWIFSLIISYLIRINIWHHIQCRLYLLIFCLILFATTKTSNFSMWYWSSIALHLAHVNNQSTMNQDHHNVCKFTVHLLGYYTNT